MSGNDSMTDLLAALQESVDRARGARPRGFPDGVVPPSAALEPPPAATAEATVAVPRVHLRAWADFLRSLNQQGAVRARNARDAVEDNAAQMDRWAGRTTGLEAEQ